MLTARIKTCEDHKIGKYIVLCSIDNGPYEEFRTIQDAKDYIHKMMIVLRKMTCEITQRDEYIGKKYCTAYDYEPEYMVA